MTAQATLGGKQYKTSINKSNTCLFTKLLLTCIALKKKPFKIQPNSPLHILLSHLTSVFRRVVSISNTWMLGITMFKIRSIERYMAFINYAGLVDWIISTYVQVGVHRGVPSYNEFPFITSSRYHARATDFVIYRLCVG